MRTTISEPSQAASAPETRAVEKNLSTWAHELFHAADNRLGNLTEKGQHWRSETVAELGGAILLECLGYSTESNLGGCWDYVAHYAEDAGLQSIQACMNVLKRTCDAVELILTEAGKISFSSRLNMLRFRKNTALGFRPARITLQGCRMKRKIVIFVVGHSDWGKASTLKALTRGDVRTKQWNIAGEWFTLKRRSNDDPLKPPYETTLQFVQRADLHHSLVLALAPSFKNEEHQTLQILETLKSKGYEMHFFVIRQQQSKLGVPAISDEEIAVLRTWGVGMTMDGYDSPEKIAIALRNYIASMIR